MPLTEFFQMNHRVALAFSGGVDSAFLLAAAIRSGADVKAYYVKTPFQPAFEFEDAKRLAEELNASMQVLYLDPLSHETVCQNPSNRCYYCKQMIFSAILQAAHEDGYTVLMDGTNASDDASDRPGMKALKELEVRSPLREYGLTKTRIRELSKEYGLFTWNKPAYACLATRIPTGNPIRLELLQQTEEAEDYLRELGFSDFRVRYQDGFAKLQVPAVQMEKVLYFRKQIEEKLKKRYKGVLLDLEARNEQ